MAATEVRHQRGALLRYPSAAATVIWTGHRQLLTATKVRHQRGAPVHQGRGDGSPGLVSGSYWPQLRCGISGALCYGTPRPRRRSSGLVTGSYWPQLRCGISGALCSCIPRPRRRVTWTGLPGSYWPQLRCGISGALCYGTPRPRRRSSGLVTGSCWPQLRCGISGALCSATWAAATVIWTGHWKLLAATEVRHQRGAMLRYLGRGNGHLD
jgi:hypothetical protein